MSNRLTLPARLVLLWIVLLTGCRPVEPSTTPAPPPATVAPTLISIPDQRSIADILAGLEGLPIDQFFEESYLQLGLRDPDYLVAQGLADRLGIANDRFTDMSDAYIRQTQQLEAGILELLRGYDRSAMRPDQQLSYDVYEWILDDRVRGQEFMYYDYPVNPMSVWGIQTWLIDFMVNEQPIADRGDAEDYIARLSELDTWMEQLLEGLRLREEAGIILPSFLVRPTITQIEDHIQMLPSDQSGALLFAVSEIELYKSFQDKLSQVDGISEDEKQALLDQSKIEIEETVIPAFLELRDYLTHLAQIATADPGVWRFPDGESYYAYELQHNTSTGMTPDEIHALGLVEVERLQREMREVAHDELDYPLQISMEELFARLSADSKLFEGKALRDQYWKLIEEADQAAEDFFDRRPSADLVIRSDPLTSVAYYSLPPLDGSGPGVFSINQEAEPTPHYRMPTVVYHETIPGHHLQGALALDFELPTFRRNLVLNAYNEGWAFYAERLAWEMGLYKRDPLGNLGRLVSELERAARLVVDTGLHAKRWTMHQAALYFQKETGAPYNQASLTRYVVLPGQGCGYTVGYLKIMELRQRAMNQLGDRFDIKEFHNIVLGQGSLPLGILERIVDEWIETELAP